MEPTTSAPSHEAEAVLDVFHTICCIVGGGPAGAVLALHLARQGVDVMLLDAHKDFDRDFRAATLCTRPRSSTSVNERPSKGSAHLNALGSTTC